MNYDEMFFAVSKISSSVFLPFYITMKDLSVSSANTHSLSTPYGECVELH